MSDIETKIQQHIKKFVAELNDLVREAAIQAVSDALRPKTTSRAASPRPPAVGAEPKTRSKKKGGRRNPHVMKKQQEALVSYITANPGRLMENIAKALGSSSKEMGRPVSKLIEVGAVHRVGERRASRYFPGPADAATRKTATKTTKAAPRKRANRSAGKAAKRNARKGPGA